MSRLLRGLTIAVSLGAAACRKESVQSARATGAALSESAAVPGVVVSPDDGEWTMASHDFAATRFSGLDELTPANVSRLRVAFTFDTHLEKGEEAAPLVVGGTMYVVTPYP